jgi:hypothetical protein
MSTSELYIYLGFASRVHFYFHVRQGEENADAIVEECGQVYNLMIHEERLDRDEAVVVYNVLGGGRVLPVFVTHESFVVIDFPDGALAMMLGRLAQADRSNDEQLIVISAVPGMLALSRIDLTDELRGMIRQADQPFDFEPLRQVMTKKPLTYL